MIQETSKQVYFHEVKPTLGDRQKRVYEVLNGYNDLTNKELASLLGWEINTVTPRVNELVKLGLVEEVTKRKCRASGRTAIAWGIKKILTIDVF